MKIEEKSDENLCARLFNFFTALPFRKRRRSEWKHDKVFRVYFWKPPAKKNRFRETENSSWSLMFRGFAFRPGSRRMLFLPTPSGPRLRVSAMSLNKGWAVFWQTSEAFERLLTSRELGSKNILHALSFFRCVSSAGKRKAEPCSLIFHYKRCVVELTSWFCACYSGGGDWPWSDRFASGTRGASPNPSPPCCQAWPGPRWSPSAPDPIPPSSPARPRLTFSAFRCPARRDCARECSRCNNWCHQPRSESLNSAINYQSTQKKRGDKWGMRNEWLEITRHTSSDHRAILHDPLCIVIVWSPERANIYIESIIIGS